MPRTITALFAQRREAEMTVEHFVQQHGIDRGSVRIATASDENTAGTEVAGGDVEGGHAKTDTDGGPALAGKIRVSADVAEGTEAAVVTSFETYGGTQITS